MYIIAVIWKTCLLFRGDLELLFRGPMCIIVIWRTCLLFRGDLEIVCYSEALCDLRSLLLAGTKFSYKWILKCTHALKLLE
jgi:hypothetical protein